MPGPATVRLPNEHMHHSKSQHHLDDASSIVHCECLPRPGSANVGATYLCFQRVTFATGTTAAAVAATTGPAITGLAGVAGNGSRGVCPIGSVAVRGTKGAGGGAFEFDPKGGGLRLCVSST